MDRVVLEGVRSMPSPEEFAKLGAQLQSEATALSNRVAEASGVLPTLAEDVRIILAKAKSSSKQTRTLEIFESITARNRSLTDRIGLLYKRAKLIFDALREAPVEQTVITIRDRLQRVDPEKLADEELLALCYRARHTVEAAPGVLSLHLVLAHLPLDSLTLLHHDALCTFLGKPTGVDRAKGMAAPVFEAAVLDGIGLVVPGAGTVKAIIEVTQPHLEQEIQRFGQAATQIDRAFRLDDLLSDLCSFADSVDSCEQQARIGLDQYLEILQRDADWLADTLKQAARD